MKGNFVYYLLDPKRFSKYTLQTIIFPTNQSKLASDNARTNENSRYKSHNLWQNRQRASERRVNESGIGFESSKSLGECVKFGENRRNIQKIFDSVGEIQDEITVLDRS